MTQAYEEWLEGRPGAQSTGPVPWTRLIPPGWQGNCCYCRRRLTSADWQAGEVAAAALGSEWHCLCLYHLSLGAPERERALDALARAVLGV